MACGCCGKRYAPSAPRPALAASKRPLTTAVPAPVQQLPVQPSRYNITPEVKPVDDNPFTDEKKK